MLEQKSWHQCYLTTRWLPAALLIVIALVVTNAPAANSALELSTLNLNEVIDNAELTEAVYHDDLLRVGGWVRKEFVKSPNGLQWGLYEKDLGNGKKDWRLVFAGTQDWKDLVSDAVQALAPSGGLLARMLPTDGQYSEALDIATLFVSLKDQNPNISLSVTGHSLGGGLAQYVATRLGIKGMVFDAAAMGGHTIGKIPKDLWQNVGRQIVHITTQGEPVHEFTRSWLGGTHVGIEFLVRPPKGTPGDPGSLHSMVTLISGLKSAAGVRDPRVTPQNIGAARDEIISQRFAVPREIAEIWARDVQVLATGLQELKLLSLDHKWAASLEANETFKRIVGKPTDKWMERFDLVSQVYDFANALQQDWADSRDSRFVLVRSHTVELLATIGLGKAFETAYESLEGRRLLRFQAQVFLDRSTAQLGTPTFGVIELVNAGFQISREGHLDIDSITSFFDAAVGLTWGVWGLAASGGNLRVAEIYQEAGQALAQTLRFATRDGFQQLVARRRGQADTIVAMWRQSQEVVLYRGGKLQSIEDWLGDDARGILAASGVGDGLLRELGAEHRERMDKKASLSATPPNSIELPDAGSPEAAATTPADGGIAGTRKAIVFGNGPYARGIYERLAARVGKDNVRLVEDVTSTYECNRLTQEFGADAIVRSVHSRYRETTVAGYTSIVPISDAGKVGNRVPSSGRSDPLQAELGGVDMNIRPRQIHGTNAASVRMLLKNRPKNDSLEWDVIPAVPPK